MRILVGVPFTTALSLDAVERRRNDEMISYRHYCSVLGDKLYADTETIKWMGHRCYPHIYFDSNSIDAYRKNSVGWFVLAMNDIKEPVKALEVCWMKDAVEKHFDDLKNDLDMKRLRIHSVVAMDGRLFIQYINILP